MITSTTLSTASLLLLFCVYLPRRSALNDAAKGISLATILEGCARGGAPAACPASCADFFDAVRGSPNRFVHARLGPVVVKRKRHIACVLRQPDMARIHGDAG